jgi:hypothetical protein
MGGFHYPDFHENQVSRITCKLSLRNFIQIGQERFKLGYELISALN